jgi:hypothetical protein
MPLLDHFRPPVTSRVKWQSFHSLWAGMIAVQLNQSVLSKRYLAVPQTQFGTSLQVDVATFEEEALSPNGPTEEGGVVTAVWAPPKATCVLKRNLADLDVLEVQVHRESDRTLVGAIELVSPANKDRPEERTAFVSKVAGYLQEKVGVVVVDVVTERLSSLHAELMRLLNADEEEAFVLDSDLYATAYRATGKGKRSRVEMWLSPLTLLQPLPVMPLWLASEQAVPVDLETSYAAASAGLRVG